MTSVRFSTAVLTTVVLLAAPTPAQHAGIAPAEYQARARGTGARPRAGRGVHLQLGLVTTSSADQAGLCLFHGTGHPLGLQTHDVYDRARPYEAGMVFTNEPGVYVRKDDIPDSAIF